MLATSAGPNHNHPSLKGPVMARTDSIPPVLTAKQIERFWSKVAIGSADECWPWTAAVLKVGYGKYSVRLADNPIKPITFGAHVIAKYLADSKWPGGLCVLHTCDNHCCCNPAHLWLGTHADNSADMVAKGRSHKPFRVGEAGHNVKLTEAKVLEIRRLHAAGGVTYVQLGQQFGVHPVSIRLIVKRINWSHLP